MKTAQTSIPLPPNVIKEMNTPESSAFYRKFLRNEIADRKLPKWMLPKLVADGQIAMANKIFPMIKLDGEALEWAYLFLGCKANANVKTRRSIELAGKSYRISDEVRKLLGEKMQEITALSKKIIKKLDDMSTIQREYTIKTPEIFERVVKLWE